jgi:hypothetical protein
MRMLAYGRLRCMTSSLIALESPSPSTPMLIANCPKGLFGSRASRNELPQGGDVRQRRRWTGFLAPWGRPRLFVNLPADMQLVLVRKCDRKRDSAHKNEADSPSRIQIEPASRHELPRRNPRAIIIMEARPMNLPDAHISVSTCNAS